MNRRERTVMIELRNDGAKIAILGGGMGSMAAAWYLSQPGWEDRFDDITVYQRGWRLGGKGASGRGTSDRVEEHGLHVLLGYYHNVFRLLDEVYAELDRDRTDPECPIRSLDHMLQASPRVGVTDFYDDTWTTWTAAFSTDGRAPTRPLPPDSPMGIVDMATQALRLLVDFAASTIGAADPPRREPLVRLDLEPEDRRRDAFDWLARIDTTAGRSVASVLAGALEAVAVVRREGRRWFGPEDPFVGFASGVLDVTYERLRRLVVPNDSSRRFLQLADVVVTILRGLAAEGVLTHPGRLRQLDDMDFRAWLTKHGADDVTVESPLIRGVYDLAFAYRDGDPARPAFPAGLGIYLSGRMFFDYRGSIFWKMRCGIGDAIFAPMYEALERRGVRFEFFHTVKNLEVGPGRRIDGIEFARQAATTDGRYRPLVRVGQLPSWPAEPLVDQLTAPLDHSCEALWGDPHDAERCVLRRGEDFDIVVLGVSLGIVPYVGRELIETEPRWKTMVERVATVPTQAIQLWLRPTERELGWDHDDVTISGYVEPFDTWASMNHVLEFESWPADGPRTLAYFCNALQTAAAPTGDGHAEAMAQVRLNAIRFLDEHVGLFWPNAQRLYPNRFDWEQLYTADDSRGEARLDRQYLRANLDPSDHYVQALPGTAHARLRTDETGFDNLYVVGDWIDTGLNAGCLESAVMAGMQAANAIHGTDRQVDIAALAELREYFG